MKKLGLKNIIPHKYNDFFSIHRAKALSKEKIYNLPTISNFSRNFNKNISKSPFLFKTLSKSDRKYINSFHTNKIQEFDNNLERVPYPSFFRLTNYIKEKNVKNKTKINNQFSPSNRVNEVYFDINKTEYNQANRKCFSIELTNNLKKKNKIKLINNKNNNLQINEILEKEKEEFRKTMNIPQKRKEVINEFSYIIYKHFFPNNKNYNYNYDSLNQEKKTNLKLSLINKINDKKLINSTSEGGTNLIKHNTFFEMIIEKVFHMVEYKNQLNQEISINLVRNLLNEEINEMWNNLNNKNKSNYSKITTYESLRINKSTSTDENFYSDFKLLNSTYSKYDQYSNYSISEHNIEKKARIKLERRLSILNNKYGFVNKNNEEIATNYDLFSNYSKNLDNFSQSETDNIIKSKKNIFYDDEDNDNNPGDYIINTANNINENLYDYKKSNFISSRKSIFRTSNIKNLLSQFITTTSNNRQGLRDFKNQIFDKKNINFNDYKNSIIHLYQNFLELKERMKENGNNQIKDKNGVKYFDDSINDNPFFDTSNSNSNLNNSDKSKEKKNHFRPKISSNMTFEDFFEHINNDKEFESFINGFGGYYTFGEKKNIKEIIQKMREESKVVKFKYDTSKSKNRAKNRGLFNSNNTGFLNKASQKAYQDKIQKNNISNTSNKNEPSQNKNSINKNFSNNKNDNKNDNENNNTKSNSNSFINDDNEQKNETSNNFVNINNKQENSETNNKKNNNNKIEKPKLDKSLIRKTKIKTFNLENIDKNQNLNEIEKEFIKQTNNLDNLDEKDKQQIIDYLKELDSIIESEKNGSINIYSRTKIKKLHYMIEQYISDLFKRGLVKLKQKGKGTKDILKLLRNNHFYENQRRIYEDIEEEEEEEESEKGNNPNDNIDIEIDSMFIRGKKRSRSVDIRKFKCYYKLYHTLLFKKLKNKKKFKKNLSAKKRLDNVDWNSIIKRRYKRIVKKKKTKFVKKKRRIFEKTKRLMIDDFKDVVPIRGSNVEDEEIRQFLEEEMRKKLKQELIDRKMKEFFKKIQKLKNGGMDNFERELELLVDEQLERIDYSKDKENEYRINNFFQDFDYSRNKDMLTKQFKSKRMHYLSPIIFFTNKNKNNINK